MSIFTSWPWSDNLVLSKASTIKKVFYIFQWLDNVNMHKYAKFDQNIPCGVRVIDSFTNY